MTCVFAEQHTFLKIPLNPKSPIEFKIENVPGYSVNIEDYPGITIHFYMKFEGVLQELTTDIPYIIKFRPNTYISYNTLTSYLE